MVDAELSALPTDALVRRCGAVSEPFEFRVELREDQAAHVVKQGRDRELVALAEPRQLGDPLRRVSSRDGVAPESLVTLRPGAGDSNGS
jgi:hypothetical protein